MDSARRKTLHSNAEQGYITANPKSRAHHTAACESLPGGNTRTALYHTPFPLYIVNGKGSRLFDADGHEYIDLLGEFTAGIYGHSDPTISDALVGAVQRGLNFGGHHSNEKLLADLIKQRFPSIELIRFTNSGTEANGMAIAVAKVFTAKTKIVVFAGAYHGSGLSFVTGVGDSLNCPHNFVVAEYNNLESVNRVMDDDVAAVMLEPMLGSGGGIVAERAFLEGLRTLTRRYGSLLIFDEVMTSRMHRGGGLQDQLPVHLRPDLTTLGKYLGGGASFGAFGGRRDIMCLFDPPQPGSLTHAGTFNNNVLTMAAGCAGLQHVFTPDRAESLHETGDRLRTRLRAIANGTTLRILGTGSILVFHFLDKPLEAIQTPKDLLGRSMMLSELFHFYLIDRGFYIARRGFVALSMALNEQELEQFTIAVGEFLDKHLDLIRQTEYKSIL